MCVCVCLHTHIYIHTYIYIYIYVYIHIYTHVYTRTCLLLSTNGTKQHAHRKYKNVAGGKIQLVAATVLFLPLCSPSMPLLVFWPAGTSALERSALCSACVV